MAKFFFGANGFQDMFVYQSILDAIILKKDKGPDYVLSWKSKRVYTSKLKLLYTAFLHSIKLYGYKVGIKFDKDPSAVKQNNYATKIVNAYIVYDLDTWTNNPVRNVTFKKVLVWGDWCSKNSDKEKWVFSGYWITFYGKHRWNSSNEFARNVLIFGIDKSSSSHGDNCKNNCLVPDEGQTYGINGSFLH